MLHITADKSKPEIAVAPAFEGSNIASSIGEETAQ
jgi:hypothetical protein